MSQEHTIARDEAQKELTRYMDNLLHAGMNIDAVLGYGLPIAEDLIMESHRINQLTLDKRSAVAIAASDLLLDVANELEISLDKRLENMRKSGSSAKAKSKSDVEMFAEEIRKQFGAL